MRILLNCLAVGLIAILAGCSKEESIEDPSYHVKLSFKPMVNGLPLQSGTEYLNILGEDFTVSAFKIYLTNISLNINGTQQAYEKESYHLVDGLDATTQSFTLALDKRQFNQLSFLVGVDSARNVSGAQTGALDPSKGMFWTWNTGYIMAKLEGTSSFSTQVNNSFVYHIGGFKENEKSQRPVLLGLPDGQQLLLEKNKIPEIIIEISLDKWFSSVHNLPISTNSLWMTPGGLSLQYADNYATMFMITDVIDQ
jgi:hypothetical protein